MSEQSFSPMVVPGTFIRVRAEGLISVGGISTGNIGIVGTAIQGAGKTELLSNYSQAIEKFGRYDASSVGEANLVRGLELLYANGARTVYARALAEGDTNFKAAMDEVIKEDVNILVIPELPTDTATGSAAILSGIASTAENQNKDLFAIVGSDETDVDAVKTQADAVSNKRLMMVAPGIKAAETLEEGEGDAKTTKTTEVTLSGNYTAACVAGLLSATAPHISPTNKVLPAVSDLEYRYAYGELEALLNAGVAPVELRNGARVVRGITTDINGPFAQVTTRRIVDKAKAGVRQVGEAFVGRLNNERVRAALKGAIQGFLDRMVSDEALLAYGLEVSATRDEQIAGIARVDLLLQPTFSIDYLAVTIVLE